MYHQQKPWEKDEFNSGYGNLFSNKKDLKYHEQKYGSENKEPSSDYMKKDEAREKDEKKESLFEEADEKKKDEQLKEEDIPFKAAKQVFNESRREEKKEVRKKNISSIEEAIKKAIEDEKKVIMMD